MTNDTTAQATVLTGEARHIAHARAAFHFLSAEMSELKPMRVQVSVATDTYDSLDEMVDLIRAKLEPGSLTLWAVDSADEDTDGITICITGNNDKGEDHAKWIATMWANMPLVLDHMDSLLTTVRVQQENIDTLTEQVRVLRECVDWYADPENWDTGIAFVEQRVPQTRRSFDDDAEVYEQVEDNGDLARSALAALEGES